MARRAKVRTIESEPDYIGFTPDGIIGCEEVVMTMDEYEVVRLIDLERLSQEEASKRMGVARTTVTGIYDRARYKLADALVNGKKLVITGGNVRFPAINEDVSAPVPKQGNVRRIAATWQDGQVFQRFGKSDYFKLYDIVDGHIVSSCIVETGPVKHRALASFLQNQYVDEVICGSIGGNAQAALDAAHIVLHGGVSGFTDTAVQQLLEGTLDTVIQDGSVSDTQERER